MLKFTCNIDYIPVSVDFIENYMPDANGAFVKVYLLSLSLAHYGYEMSTNTIAGQLNLLESDVINAFEYWNEKGALKYDGESVMFFSQQTNVQPAVSSTVEVNTTADVSNIEKSEKKSFNAISGAMTSNKALADLCLLSQEILGKSLSNNDIETLYWFYDELELSPEVITMLLEYCVSKDIRNMKYIEKVAVSWHKKGIFTIDEADKLIATEKEKQGFSYKIKKIFGIDGRNLSKKEESFIKIWHEDYSMSEEMVELAYEYCIMQTAKLSFPYINSILKRWSELNILTVEEAKRDHDDFKNKSRNQDLNVYNDDNINYDELEKIMRDKM